MVLQGEDVVLETSGDRQAACCELTRERSVAPMRRRQRPGVQRGSQAAVLRLVLDGRHRLVGVRPRGVEIARSALQLREMQVDARQAHLVPVDLRGRPHLTEKRAGGVELVRPQVGASEPHGGSVVDRRRRTGRLEGHRLPERLAPASVREGIELPEHAESPGAEIPIRDGLQKVERLLDRRARDAVARDEVQHGDVEQDADPRVRVVAARVECLLRQRASATDPVCSCVAIAMRTRARSDPAGPPSRARRKNTIARPASPDCR